MGIINNHIFRAYDIRGVYPMDIDGDVAEKVGKSFGKFIGAGKKVLVGRDIRTSSPELAERVIDGVLGQGLDVVYAGIIPTPLLYFAISHFGLDGGITVSASHNPPEWNGFKMCKKNAYAIAIDSGLKEIREFVNRNEFEAHKKGTMVDRSSEIMSTYLEFLSGNVGKLDGLKIGIDPGNGGYSEIATDTFRKKGAIVHSINDIPDGRFPNRSPEPKPSTIKELIGLVKSEGLDLGVAFDGDGDRVLFVTDTGAVLGGDQVLALLIRQYLKRGEKVAYEVSCSSVVEDELKERGGIPMLTKVGHSYFKDTMKNDGCRFGGEISGHMYFKEMNGGDDGLFAALKVADMVMKTGKSLSVLFGELNRYIKISREFDVPDSKKFEIMKILEERLSAKGYRIIDMDGVKTITEDGWFVIRASNTTPAIKMSAEAHDEKRLRELEEMAVRELESAKEELQ